MLRSRALLFRIEIWIYTKGCADKIGTVFFCAISVYKKKPFPEGNGFGVFGLIDSRAGRRESRGISPSADGDAGRCPTNPQTFEKV